MGRKVTGKVSGQNGVTMSRTAARKAQRQAKSDRKRLHFESRKRDRDVNGNVRKEVEKNEQKTSENVNARHARKLPKISPEMPLPSFLNDHDDPEIAYLEKKLGLRSSKQEAINRNKKRLARELAADGLGGDFMEFLDVLDKGESIKKLDERQMKNPDDLKVENREAEDDSDSSDSRSRDSESDSEGDSHHKIFDNNETEKNSEVTYLPSSDLYGKSLPTVSAKHGEISSVTNNSQDDEQRLRIRRVLNRLVNRLSVANITPTATQIAAQFKDFPSTQVNQVLTDIILTTLGNEFVVLNLLGTLFAALVALVSLLVGSTSVGAFLTEKAVVRFQKLFEEDKGGLLQDGGEAVVSKRATNLALFVCHLYSFGVVTSGLIFDLLNRMSKNISDESVAIILIALSECGNRLRKDNPAGVLEFVKLIFEKQEEIQSSSGRLEMLLQKVRDLKNNKIVSATADDRVKALTKTIRFVQNSRGAELPALRLSWEDLIYAESRGRWWIVGGAWTGQEEALRRTKDQNVLENPSLGKSSLLAQTIAKAPKELIELARKQRMNTDVRRAIFFSIMAAESVIEAFDKLMALNLTDRQQREIVYVLTCCCCASKTYNDFFMRLGSYLCKQQSAFKFTFQLAFFDIIKSADSYKPRKLVNLATMLADLVLQQDLPLSTLKVVEFTELRENMRFFIREFFLKFLLYGEGKEGARIVARATNRLGSAKNFDHVADGVRLFLGQEFADYAGESLLQKRIKVVSRVLNALSAVHANYEEPSPYEAGTI